MKSKLIFQLLICLSTASVIQAQSAEFVKAQTMAQRDAIDFKCAYDEKRNIYITKGNVIHIFLFEDGNLLLAGYPTTATERDKYSVHLYVKASNNDNYLLEYTGSYTPVLNIQNQNQNVVPPPAAAPGGPAPPQDIHRIDFAVIGPFTSSLVMTLKNKKAGADYSVLVSTSIRIAPTIYASIGAGFVVTTLKSPSNVHTSQLPSGDTTLIADNPGVRGMLTLMATFYPWGRNNLLIPSWKFKDRFGIVVGTSIAASTANFQNFFLGGQYDFSIGGSIITGVQWGSAQRIAGVNLKNFTFGESKYSGNLSQSLYTGWYPGFFIGVQMDSRIFSQLFPSK